jgi:histidyl-tRNA synthetase
MTIRGPKGTDDILPPASRTWARVLRTWDDLVARYGYEPALVPLFELTEVFARGVGETTEVVSKQMYTFDDRGGRSLSLRPEGTAGIVRAYIQQGSPGTVKLSYSGPMFRYEQPQAGRRRQFWQTGVEYLDVTSPWADAEVIEVGYRFLEEIGLTGVTVLLNTLGDHEDRPAYLASLRDWLRRRSGDLSEDSRRRIETNPMRVLDSKEDIEVVAGAPTPHEFVSASAAEHHRQVIEALDAAAIVHVAAPRLVRGLDYYTRTAFEYVVEGYDAAQASMGGGGRYDGLAEVLGGRSTPSVGLAMGIDRIILALAGSEEALPLDVFVVLADPALHPETVGLVGRLRRAGVSADFDPEPGSVKAQFRRAGGQARYAAVVGEEWAAGKVVVRHLGTGEQQLVDVDDLDEWVTSSEPG